MRIFDIYDNEMDTYDPEKGHVYPDRIVIAHHPAVEEVQEQGHYAFGVRMNQVLAEGAFYPNGGQDAEWVIDIPYVKAEKAWDEFENVLRYVPYTAEELSEREAAQKRAERLEALIAEGALQADLKELYEALDMILRGVTE